MKKFYIFAFMAVMSVALAKAIVPYNPPEFVDDEWTYIGMGTYEPGIFDNFGNEWPFDVDCKCYENKANAGMYWVEPIQPEDLNPEEALPVAGAFILHAENPNQVWTTPIWCINPMIFCYYQMVPEVMGMQGSTAAYGKIENWHATFPAGSYMLGTMPGESQAGNNAGTFAVNIPDPAGINCISADTTAPGYYNMQGVQVSTPQAGEVYIVKKGNKTSKVRF